MSAMKYAREREKSTATDSGSKSAVSRQSRPSPSWSTGTTMGVSALPLTSFPITCAALLR